MSHQQSFISEIPVDINSEIREDESIEDESIEDGVSDRPNLNVVNAAIEAARIAKESYIASTETFRQVLESQGYRMEQIGSYEDATYHMVHSSVSIEDLDYWGKPKDGIDPTLVIAF